MYGIFTSIWVIYGVNAGTYSSTMKHIGIGVSTGQIIVFVFKRWLPATCQMHSMHLDLDPAEAVTVLHHHPLVICYIAIEHGHRNREFSHETWSFSIGMFVHQRIHLTNPKNQPKKIQGKPQHFVHFMVQRTVTFGFSNVEPIPWANIIQNIIQTSAAHHHSMVLEEWWLPLLLLLRLPLRLPEAMTAATGQWPNKLLYSK